LRLRPLGKTGLRVSEVGFGAWAIGGQAFGPTDDRESVAALRRALDLGVNFIDTADTYGDGRSERLVAEAVAGRREAVILATKVGNNFYEGPLRKDFSDRYLQFAVEKSLERLRTDRIDLYQLHNPTLEEIREGRVFETLEDLVREGKIRFYGVSVRDAPEARAVIAHGGSAALQLVHNLNFASLLPEIGEEARAAGMGIVARTPLDYGMLAGKWTSETVFPAGDHRSRRWTREQFLARWEGTQRFRFLVPAEAPSLAEAALRFVLSSPAVSVVIPGARTPAQAEANARAGEGPPGLSAEALARIAAIHSETAPRGDRGLPFAKM